MKSATLKNLISAADLSVDQIRFLLETAKSFAKQVEKGQAIPLLQGRTAARTPPPKPIHQPVPPYKLPPKRSTRRA